MDETKKGKRKADTKLSLKKKAKRESGDTKQPGPSVLPGIDELNETCEFTTAFPRVTGRAGKLQKEVLTVDDDSDESDTKLKGKVSRFKVKHS